MPFSGKFFYRNTKYSGKKDAPENKSGLVYKEEIIDIVHDQSERCARYRGSEIYDRGLIRACGV